MVNPIPNGDRKPSSPPMTLPDGRVGFPVDTVVNYTCRPYFELQGESTRTCLESGEWNRPEPRCGEQHSWHDLKFEVDLWIPSTISMQ